MIKRILLILGLLLMIICLPILLNCVIRKPAFTEVAQNNDWIGFYGGYAGSIVGGFLSFLGVFYTIQKMDRLEISKRSIDDKKQKLENLPVFYINITESFFTSEYFTIADEKKFQKKDRDQFQKIESGIDQTRREYTDEKDEFCYFFDLTNCGRNIGYITTIIVNGYINNINKMVNIKNSINFTFSYNKKLQTQNLILVNFINIFENRYIQRIVINEMGSIDHYMPTEQ